MNRIKMEISLGLVVLVALSILGYMALKLGHLKGLGSLVRVEVSFQDAAGIVEGSSIKVAGVAIGRVESLDVDFDKARVVLAIDESAGIRTDARVTVRARSLLGEKYIEIKPQSRTAPAIREGDSLEPGSGIVEIDQLIGELGPMVQALNVEDVGPLFNELKGLVIDNRQNVTEMVSRANHLLTRLETVDFDDPDLQSDLKLTLGNLREASERLPRLLDRAESTVDALAEKGEPILTRVDAMLLALQPTVETLPATMAELDDALSNINKMVAILEPLLVRADSINYSTLQKLMREEGLTVRFRPKKITWEGEDQPSLQDDRPSSAQGHEGTPSIQPDLPRAGSAEGPISNAAH